MGYVLQEAYRLWRHPQLLLLHTQRQHTQPEPERAACSLNAPPNLKWCLKMGKKTSVFTIQTSNHIRVLPMQGDMMGDKYW